VSQQQETKALMVTSLALALSSPGPASLARRAIEDLQANAAADQWFEKGMAFWNEEKYREAVRCFARSLRRNSNHAPAQFYVGLAFYQGVGVSQPDHVQAVVCWRKAAEQGNAQAQNNLAFAYEQGHGVARDYQLAVCCFRKAAEQNDATAQFNLGVLYEMGRGVTEDLEQAATWYRRASEQGCAAAQYNLGGLLRLGRGVVEDCAQAALWYRKAAQQDHPTAQFNLGVMYELGQGVKQSLEHAAFWFQKAAENGEESAGQALVDILKKLETSEQKDADQHSEENTSSPYGTMERQSGTRH
jgi:TPR repeat protein